MNKYVCFGVIKNQQGVWYRQINVETLVIEDSLTLKDKDFNEKKYYEFIKKDNSKNIFTVIAEIVFDVKQNIKSNLRGYLVVNNNTISPILVSYDKLLRLLQNNFCMNFGLTTVNNKKFLKKNSNVDILKIENNYLKGRIDFSFEDVALNSEMSRTALDFCMTYNGFELVHRETWEDDYFGVVSPFVSEIWINGDGNIIILNLVFDTRKNLYLLNYMHNTFMCLKHVDHDKYMKFLRKHSYLGLSTIPIDSKEDDLTIFYSYEFYRFMGLNQVFKSFTTNCIPLYRDERLYGASTLLPLLPNKRKWIDKVATPIIRQKYGKYNEFDIDHALRLLIGRHTLQKPMNKTIYNLYYEYAISKPLDEFVNILCNSLGCKNEISIAVRIFAEGLKTDFKI